MIASFFSLAMTTPARQLTFRRVAVGHAVLVCLLVMVPLGGNDSAAMPMVGQLLLMLGLVEGAALIGWRLTQLPKSLALEFLLVSPLQPRRVFLAESMVGICRFLLIQLTGIPFLCLLTLGGLADLLDVVVLVLVPSSWGVVLGLGLTAWVYEPQFYRRIGELFGLFGVLVYLVIGIIAGENLRLWLEQLPPSLGAFLFDAVFAFHQLNPFGIIRYWFASDRSAWLALERVTTWTIVAVVAATIVGIRAACRLKPHFHELHYQPIQSERPAELDAIGERPLSWWAVKRVLQYSGRVNLWLAVGFAFAYAAFTAAGDSWPAWMGRLVFQLFETWGGPAMVATALVVLAAVPAVYQFGLWDSTVTDRCQRLELLLLTELQGTDYAHAAFRAAWTRGRGYLLGCTALWLAMTYAGRMTWLDMLAATLGAAAYWFFAFAIGFRGFTTGNQSNGIASVVTLGFPLLLYFLLKFGLTFPAAMLPTGLVFLPARTGLSWEWPIGFVLTVAVSALIFKNNLTNCVAQLHRWYETNQGRAKVG